MQDLTTQLSAAVGQAFKLASLDSAFGIVKRSDRPERADFQCNGAMAAAKAVGKTPREIAQIVADKLAENPLLASVEIAGPGFINLKLSDAALSTHTSALQVAPQAGLEPTARPLKVFIDFAGPNVAKPMHVGHLRATIIGDSLQRITKALGHTKISDAHFGDWGLQVGLLIIALQEEQPTLPYYDPNYSGSAAPDDTPPVTLEDLERLYPAASARMKEDETWRDLARKATAELQAGRTGYRALRHLFWQSSKPALEREFAALGIHFDHWLGESDVNNLIAPMVEELTRKGVAGPDEGAITINIERNDDKAPMPPFMLVSSVGSALYGTTDLATIKDRQAQFNPDLYLYVVDQRQALHFKQLFRAATIAGYAGEKQLEHIGFGTMNGVDGKPFKTRAGGIVKLHDLITTAREKALARLQDSGLGKELSTDELDKVALSIGTAALKFADLYNHRTTDYIFDFDRFLVFEGKTGPYLQYQGVRIKSLLRKAAAAGLSAGTVTIRAPEERALALVLDAFNGAVHAAFDRRAPNSVAEHCYNLAQVFSSFYAACPILPEADASIRSSRLALATITLAQLELGLDLLGIEIPERM